MIGIQTKLSVVVCAVAVSTVLASCGNGNGKHDIFGFSPGMTKTDVEAVLESHKWRCIPQTLLKYLCNTDDGPMLVTYADNLKDRPVVELQLEIRHNGLIDQVKLEDQIENISAQYGKKPDRMLEDGTGISGAAWNLGGGNLLTTIRGGQSLDLQNEELLKKDAEEAQVVSRRDHPAIKF